MRKKLTQVKHIVADTPDLFTCATSSSEVPASDLDSVAAAPIHSVNEDILPDSSSTQHPLPNHHPDNGKDKSHNRPNSHYALSSCSDDDKNDLQEIVSYQLDANGVAKLPDGTIVVEPMPVDESANESKALVKQNGASVANLRSRSSRLVRTPGVLDLVKCTRCSEKIDPYNSEICVHPDLLVILCKKCHRHYTSDCAFDRDEKDDKDCQCRWCSGYGDLFCCDTCNNSFCVRCIKRNLGRTALSKVRGLGEGDVWECYVCQPAELEDLRKECKQIIAQVAAFKELQQRRSRHQLDKKGKSPQNLQNNNELKPLKEATVSESSPTPTSTNAAMHSNGNSDLLARNRGIRRRMTFDESNNSLSNAATYILKTGNLKSGTTLTLAGGRSEGNSSGTPPYKMLLLNSSPVGTSTGGGGGSSGMNLMTAGPTNHSSLPSSSSSKRQSAASIGNNTSDIQLPWLFSDEAVNPSKLRMLVSGALRGVASFYKEMHRLYVAVHRPDFISKNSEILDEFRTSFHDHFVNRLGRLPNHLVMSDAFPNSTSLTVTPDVRLANIASTSSSISKAAMHRPRGTPLVIDLTDETEDVKSTPGNRKVSKPTFVSAAASSYLSKHKP